MKKIISSLLSIVMLVGALSVSFNSLAASPVTFTNYSILERNTNYVKISYRINNPNKKSITKILHTIRKKGDSSTLKSYKNDVSYSRNVNVTRTIGSGKNIKYELQPGTEYEIKFGVEINGTRYYSSYYSFTTKAEENSVTFTNYTILEKQTNYVKISYRINNPNKKLITKLLYTIRKKGDSSTVKYYKKDVSYSRNVNVTKTIGSGKNINYELQPGTEYEIKFGVEINGTRYYSSYYSFRTN